MCNIPVGVDLSDILAMGTATTFVNLLTGYKVVTLDQVMHYQELVNLHGVEVDVESRTWLLNVLTQSTEESLLVQVKQTFDTFSDAQKGGLTLFKLLVDKIDQRIFESTQALINSITEFKLANFDGENVSLAAARFKAVVRLLPSASIPPNILEYFLNGMSMCSSDEFNSSPILYTLTGHMGVTSFHSLTSLPPLSRLSTLPCPLSRNGMVYFVRPVFFGSIIGIPLLPSPPINSTNIFLTGSGSSTKPVIFVAKTILLGLMASQMLLTRKNVTFCRRMGPPL